MATILRIDADDGDLTRYATAFRNWFVFGKLADEHPEHRLVEVLGQDAIAPTVGDALTPDVAFVTASGHGTYASFDGTDEKPIWKPGSDLSSLSGKIVHLLSCRTGASLGLRIVSAGARAFWGYTVDFEWVYRAERPADLADDHVAAAFFHLDAIIDRGVLAGRPADEIHDSISRYVADVIPKLDRSQRAIMLSNFVHLVWPGATWGDRLAVL